MLRALRIENFALFRDAELEFGDGFTVITGESGTGKSLCVEAISVGLGARHAADRTGPHASGTRIRLTFEVGTDHAVWSVLSPIGIAVDDWLVMQRDVTAEGRSVFRAQGQIIPAQAVREAAARLVQSTWQHQALVIAEPGYLLGWLDRFGGAATVRGRVEATYREWQAAVRERQALAEDTADPAMIDERRALLTEIVDLDLKPGEDEELTRQLARLRAGQRLIEGYGEIRQMLEGEPDGGILANVDALVRQIGALGRVDPDLAGAEELAGQAVAVLDELRLTLGNWARNLELDAGLLERTEARADRIARLKRRLGCELPEILALRDQLQTDIARMENRAWELSQLDRRVADLEAVYRGAAAELSRMRAEAALKAEEALTAVVRQMEMPAAVVTFRLGSAKPQASGMDLVECGFMAGPGQPARPLAKVASGGELSRVALGLAVLDGTRSPRTLIFDELDAGLGGASADRVGRFLQQLGDFTQVLAVSHQPTVAAKARGHWVIEKVVRGGVTESVARAATSADREREIARMLSGSGDRVALEHAQQLLTEGEQRG